MASQDIREDGDEIFNSHLQQAKNFKQKLEGDPTLALVCAQVCRVHKAHGGKRKLTFLLQVPQESKAFNRAFHVF